MNKNNLGSISLSVVILLLLSHGLSIAQPTGYKELANVADFTGRFTAEVKKINSITSSFTQEKNLSVLEEKIVSNGKFWFQRENKVRIEYQTPFHYLMIINGNQFIIRDDQKESRGNANSNKLYQQINGIILGCVQGTIFENKDFSHKVFENERQYLLEMVPVSKTLRSFFQSINVIVDKGDASVSSIELGEPNGDNTIIRFTNKRLNEKPDEALFIH